MKLIPPSDNFFDSHEVPRVFIYFFSCFVFFSIMQLLICILWPKDEIIGL